MGEAAQPVRQLQLLPLVYLWVICSSSSLTAEQLPHQAVAALGQPEQGLGGPLTPLPFMWPGILGCYMPEAVTPVDWCLVPAVSLAQTLLLPA